MPDLETGTYDDYQAGVDTVSARTGEQLVALWAAYEAGQIDQDQMQQLAVSLVMAGKMIAASRADQAVSAALTVRTGTDVGPLGLGPAQAESGRLADAVRTIVTEAGKHDPVTRIQRLGVAEVWESGAETWTDALKERNVEYWTRKTSGKSCPACQTLANGRVLRMDTPMFRHKGCDCVQQPATKENEQ